MISYVAVPVATLWTGPDAPRPQDAPAVADHPDIAAWVAGLDLEARQDLHGRTLTQLQEGEPVDVLGTHEGWSEVAAVWQPCSRNGGGYPGWVPSAQLSATSGGSAEFPAASDPGAAVLEPARTYLGVDYIWGGTCRWAVDCSGLVYLAFRDLGIQVPRDAADQQAAAEPVESGQERPGDLYFFAREGKAAHHVGFVVEPGVMLHAPESGAVVVEERITDERSSTLVGAGRLPGPPAAEES